jgi:hypothetical protein
MCSLAEGQRVSIPEGNIQLKHGFAAYARGVRVLYDDVEDEKQDRNHGEQVDDSVQVNA